MEQMDFDEDFFAKQLASARRGQIHSELYTGYRKGIIPKPKISWHETIEDIDFSLQTDRLNNKLHSEGFTVINDVNLADLIDLMTPGNRSMYKRKQLYNSTQNLMNISSIWDHWLKGEKLTPPTILIFDQPYMDLVCRGGIPSVELQPADGKHRLTVAYYFDVKTLPIIVLKRQSEEIRKMLKMS